jgi:hypothetical protein
MLPTLSLRGHVIMFRRHVEMLPEARGDVAGGTWRCYRRHVEKLPEARGDVTGGTLS